MLATLRPGSSWARRSRRIAAVELSAPARVQRRTPRSADPPPGIDVTPLVPRSPLVHHPGQRPSLANECDVWPQQERWRDVHGPIARSGRSSPWWPWRKSRARDGPPASSRTSHALGRSILANSIALIVSSGITHLKEPEYKEPKHHLDESRHSPNLSWLVLPDQLHHRYQTSPLGTSRSAVGRAPSPVTLDTVCGPTHCECRASGGSVRS